MNHTPIASQALPGVLPVASVAKRAHVNGPDEHAAHASNKRPRIADDGPRLPPELLDMVVAAVPPADDGSLLALAQTSQAMADRVARLHPDPDDEAVRWALALRQDAPAAPELEPVASACLRRARSLRLDVPLCPPAEAILLLAALREMRRVERVVIEEEPEGGAHVPQWPTFLGALPGLRVLACSSEVASRIGAALVAAGATLRRLEVLTTWDDRSEWSTDVARLSILPALVPEALRVLHLGGQCIDHADVLRALCCLLRRAPRLRALELPHIHPALRASVPHPMRELLGPLEAHGQLAHLGLPAGALEAAGGSDLTRALAAQRILSSLSLRLPSARSQRGLDVAALLRAAPRLESLDINVDVAGTKAAHADLVEAIAACPRLRHLSIQLSDECHAGPRRLSLTGQIPKLAALSSVTLRDACSRLDPAGLRRLLGAVLALPEVRTLHLLDAGCPLWAGAHWLGHLANHPAQWSRIAWFGAQVQSGDEAELIVAAASAMTGLRGVRLWLTDASKRHGAGAALARLEARGICWQLEPAPHLRR